MQYSNMTRLTCYKEQLIILFPTFKSCFAKATNRKAENILEIYSRRAQPPTSAAAPTIEMFWATFSLHPSPEEVKFTTYDRSWVRSSVRSLDLPLWRCLVLKETTPVHWRLFVSAVGESLQVMAIFAPSKKNGCLLSQSSFQDSALEVISSRSQSVAPVGR